MMKEKVFFYGTFRKGMYKYDMYLAHENTFCSYGYIKGNLYSVERREYPIYSQDGPDMILGEIHEIDEDILKIIEQDLGCLDSDSQNCWHLKQVHPIYDINGQQIAMLPLYVVNVCYNKELIRVDQLIPSGDFVTYNMKKSCSANKIFNFHK